MPVDDASVFSAEAVVTAEADVVTVADDAAGVTVRYTGCEVRIIGIMRT